MQQQRTSIIYYPHINMCRIVPNMLCRAVLCHAAQLHRYEQGHMSLYAVPVLCQMCCAVLYCVVPCCAQLCCAVLRCAALCCAVLCCAVLCHVLLHAMLSSVYIRVRCPLTLPSDLMVSLDASSAARSRGATDLDVSLNEPSASHPTAGLGSCSLSRGTNSNTALLASDQHSWKISYPACQQHLGNYV